MTEINFELTGEQEHALEVFADHIQKQNPESPVDMDAQAKQVFVEHVLQQYAQIAAQE